MKRLALAAATALMLVGPLATTASADPPRQYDNRSNDNYNGDRDRQDGRYDDRDNGRSDGRYDDRDNGRYDRDDDRRGDNRRHHRGHNRWDNQRHNGYTYNGRWNYGPPPEAYYGRQGFQPGYQSWRRGDRLPSYYQGRYRQVDYRRAHLRAPPRGYHYVEDDRGDTLLLGIATGVILSVILANNH